MCVSECIHEQQLPNSPGYKVAWLMLLLLCFSCYCLGVPFALFPLPPVPLPPASTLRLSLCTAIIWFLISVQFLRHSLRTVIKQKVKGVNEGETERVEWRDWKEGAEMKKVINICALRCVDSAANWVVLWAQGWVKSSSGSRRRCVVGGKGEARWGEGVQGCRDSMANNKPNCNLHTQFANKLYTQLWAIHLPCT